ncbi:hypothetical protein [Sorangium sp. So ce131]|uniref:hypothetical protein n=1 Tax=Sorangium sp. So ce131 TaxID=3133282 RepID=UPI003F61B16C
MKLLEHVARYSQQPIDAIVGRTRELPGDPQRRRAAAAELAREDGVHDAAINSVLEEEVTDAVAARSTLWWANRMKLRERELLDSPEEATPKNTGVRRKVPGS